MMGVPSTECHGCLVEKRRDFGQKVTIGKIFLGDFTKICKFFRNELFEVENPRIFWQVFKFSNEIDNRAHYTQCQHRPCCYPSFFGYLSLSQTHPAHPCHRNTDSTPEIIRSNVQFPQKPAKLPATAPHRPRRRSWPGSGAPKAEPPGAPAGPAAPGFLARPRSGGGAFGAPEPGQLRRRGLCWAGSGSFSWFWGNGAFGGGICRMKSGFWSYGWGSSVC